MATTLFDDITTEVTALDLVTRHLGGRVVDNADTDQPDPETWRGFDDRAALEDERAYDLMLAELATAQQW